MQAVIRCSRAPWLVGSLAAVMLAAMARNTEAAEGNLLVNGDFERGLEGWKAEPESWFKRENTQSIEPQFDRTVFHGPRGQSLKLVVTKGKLGYVNQTVPLDPNTKKYRLRFWIKTKDFPAEAMAGAVISWNKPKDVPGFGNQWAFVGFEASDWRELQRVVHIESTDNRATVKFFATRKEASSLPDKGTFWFDDFELIPLKDKGAGRAWQPPAGFKPVEAAAKAKGSGYPLGWGYPPSLCVPESPARSEIKLTRFRPGLATTASFNSSYAAGGGVTFPAPSFADVGVFPKGEPITMVLEGTNPFPRAKRVGVRLEVKDFYGKAHAENRVILQLPPGDFREQLTLANPERYGYFNVLAEVWAGGHAIGWAPSSFCVLQKSEPDPFFDLNELQGGDHTWIPIYRFLGFGAINFRWGWQGFGITSRDYKKDLDALIAHPFYAAYLKSDFQIMAVQSLGPPHWVPAWWRDAVKEKLARNENPYTEEFYADVRNFCSALADAWPKNARMLTYAGESAGAEPFAEQLQPRMAKIIHEVFKKKRPEVKLTLCLGSGQAWRLDYTRKMIPLLLPYADMVGGDIYSSAPGEPEVGETRERIQEALDWAKQYRVPQEFFIPESYCGDIARTEPLDSNESQQSACQIVRHIVLSKSVPGVVAYGYNRAVALESQRNATVSSLWKSYNDGHSEPRAAVATFSAMSGFLAHTTDPLYLHPHEDFYGVVFRKGTGTRAVFWSVANEPARFRLKLPAAAELYDAVGEERGEETGEVTLSASDDPTYVVTDADAKAFAAALGGAKFLEERTRRNEILRRK